MLLSALLPFTKKRNWVVDFQGAILVFNNYVKIETTFHNGLLVGSECVKYFFMSREPQIYSQKNRQITTLPFEKKISKRIGKTWDFLNKIVPRRPLGKWIGFSDTFQILH